MSPFGGTQIRRIREGRSKLTRGLILDIGSRNFCRNHRDKVATGTEKLETLLGSQGFIDTLVGATTRCREGASGGVEDWRKASHYYKRMQELVGVLDQLHELCNGSWASCTHRIHGRANKLANFLNQAKQAWEEKSGDENRSPPRKTLITPPTGELWCSDMSDPLGRPEALDFLDRNVMLEIPEFPEGLNLAGTIMNGMDDLIGRHEATHVHSGEDGECNIGNDDIRSAHVLMMDCGTWKKLTWNKNLDAKRTPKGT